MAAFLIFSMSHWHTQRRIQIYQLLGPWHKYETEVKLRETSVLGKHPVVRHLHVILSVKEDSYIFVDILVAPKSKQV